MASFIIVGHFSRFLIRKIGLLPLPCFPDTFLFRIDCNKLYLLLEYSQFTSFCLLRTSVHIMRCNRIAGALVFLLRPQWMSPWLHHRIGQKNLALSSQERNSQLARLWRLHSEMCVEFCCAEGQTINSYHSWSNGAFEEENHEKTDPCGKLKKCSFAKILHLVRGREKRLQKYRNYTSDYFWSHRILQIWFPVTFTYMQTLTKIYRNVTDAWNWTAVEENYDEVEFYPKRCFSHELFSRYVNDHFLYKKL